MDFLPSVIVVLSTILILFLIRQWFLKLEEKSKISEELVSWLKELGESNRQVDNKLTHNMDMFNQRLDKAAQAMQGVNKSIGEFSEIGRSMKQLQDFLQSPKLRGNIGEQILKELLAQSLPPETYSLQYEFKNGQRADAIVKTAQGLIAIDSKFPLSNFKAMIQSENQQDKDRIKKEFVRDVKKHISSISSKYIQASDGTLDYALMYVPSESVYYEMLNLEELYDYAAEMRVVPVSPLSFYAFLRVILISHEGARIQSKTKEILSALQSIRKDFERTDESLNILSKHIANAYNQSGNLTQNFSRLGQKINSTRAFTPEENKKLQ